MLDLAHLRLLRTVVATGSLRASAETLGYTSSAASQQLAALQRQTGLQLVERVGRGLEPTAAGRALATESANLLDEMGRVEGVIKDLRAGRLGSISIGYVASVSATWLPPLIETLRTEFPALRLDLRLIEVADGQHDIEIYIENPAEPPPPSAHLRRLAADPYVVALRRDDPLAAAPAVPLAELGERAWIDNEPSDGPCRRILLDACAQADITPNFQVQTPDYRTALSLVATGIGITVIPRLAAVDPPAGVRILPLTNPTPTRHVGLAIRAAAATNPAVRRAAELLKAVASAPVNHPASR
ncbi:DNA-binding transcriptional LysR family regulator [Nocardia sp. GAS34]|uniref:LysR family transcriptional regulator n=1 Tax=unclassified Nocardia TaxID=2637762 RepID=UPI003D204BFC